MRKVIVELGERSYPICIGDNLLADSALFRSHIPAKQVMIVTNQTVAPLYLDRLMACLDGLSVDTCILPDGEKYKTLDTVNTIVTRLLEKRYGRSSTLVALGGGVVGDVTGFTAACYQRGIGYLQVPTTVLAQVDSAVGGKTAVNHALGKNMIGAFHQPLAVIADVSVLSTLDPREFRAGLAEVIKYGLIRDGAFFDWLEQNLDGVLKGEHETLVYAIERSCRNKADVVAMDEKESGPRAILNLGHTFGHAIETGLGYQDWLHGEAVAVGILMAADLSCRLGWITREDVERISRLLARAHLPSRLPGALSPGRLLEIMAVDKKARDGVMVLVLLEGIGNAVVTDRYDREKLEATIKTFSTLQEIA